MWEIWLDLLNELLELMKLNKSSAFNINLIEYPIIEELSLLVEHDGDFHSYIQEFHCIKLYHI